LSATMKSHADRIVCITIPRRVLGNFFAELKQRHVAVGCSDLLKSIGSLNREV